MGLLDLFRPKWKHSRLDVRLEAVRQLSDDEAAILYQVAKFDTESKVREVALKRLSDPSVLDELASAESDDSLKQLAKRRSSEVWLAIALVAEADRDAVAAVERINTPKMLVDVIRKAHSAAARSRALLRLDDPRSLAEVAQKAEDPQIRAEAVSKISEPKVLRDLAMTEATKAVQLMALERLSDGPSLRTVAEKGRSKALRQAAKDRLAALGISNESAPKEKKAKKPLDPAAEARLKQRKIEADMRRRIEEERKAAPANRKAQLEAEHAERARRMEAEEAAAKVEAPRVEKPAPVQAEAPRPRERAEDPEEAARRAARDAEKARKLEEKSAHAKEHAAQLESMTERLEALIHGKDLKAAGDALKEARERARAALPEGSEQLRDRFEAARTALGGKLNELREAEDWRRWANVPKLEALITRAESLAKVVIGAVPLGEGEELDARKVSRELRAMQAEWKEIGGAPKEKADSLWERFKASSDIIYEGNKKGLDSLDEERLENLKMKEELCARVEALVAAPEATSNPKSTSEQIKQLQEDWKKIGPVPKVENDKIWERFRSSCDKFFAERKVAFGKQDEIRGATLEKQLALVAKAEALKDSQDFKGTADKLKALQDEWKKLGPGKKGESDEAWQKFRAACDHFFEKRKAHFGEMDEERGANLAKKEALVASVEALAKSDETVDADAKIRELMAEWKKIGPVAKDKGDEVWARFGKALDALRNPEPPPAEIVAEAKGLGFSNNALMEKLGKTAASPSPTPITSPTPKAPTPEPVKAAAPTPTHVPTPTPMPAPLPIEEPHISPAPAPSPSPIEVPVTTPLPTEIPSTAVSAAPTAVEPPTAAAEQEAWPAPEAWTLPDEPNKG